jgi:hypothetical protein
MTILEYTNWRNFEKLINKSITSLENSNIKVSDHFDVDIKIVEAGISKKTIEDYKLTRYACYILVQANNTHFKIGEKVRETMIEISGVASEELPTPEKGIKQIQKEKKQLAKKNSKTINTKKKNK